MVLAGLLIFQAGCALLPKGEPGPVPLASWKTVAGQVRYQDSKRSIVADVTIRVGKNPREYSMEVSKAGAVLLHLDRAERIGWARGPLAHWPFHDAVEKAPGHLQGWYRETSAALENSTVPQPAGETVRIQFRLQR